MERVDARQAIWTGRLRPFLLSYEIRIAYRAPMVVERIDPLRQQPRVRVMSPPLRRRPGDPEGSLPHVYADDPTHPALCLFDHETSEWTPFHLLSNTTVPWALDWLGCYEGWRATGSWTGGGRHADSSPAEGSLR
ncbi:MAG: hypothetical protein WAP03_30040 [Methylorubrum rhodinum]|uniref:hypothetical protein n=1 Tax=Methylorubrum rhodinum TaxID=29428 RepID=UPI003BAF701B